MHKVTCDNSVDVRWWWPWILLFWWRWWLLWSSSSSLSSCSFNRLCICYTNLTSESEPSRNQWPKFGVPKERSFVRLTHERFYFYKLDHKINWILLMLKRNFFCTVAWSWILLLVIYHSSSYNLSPVFFCYYFIHIQGETVKNCSEIDCTLYLNHLGTSGQNLVSLRKDHLSDSQMKELWKSYFFWIGWEN